jgi:hypothetical protein
MAEERQHMKKAKRQEKYEVGRIIFYSRCKKPLNTLAQYDEHCSQCKRCQRLMSASREKILAKNPNAIFAEVTA